MWNWVRLPIRKPDFHQSPRLPLYKEKLRILTKLRKNESRTKQTRLFFMPRPSNFATLAAELPQFLEPTPASSALVPALRFSTLLYIIGRIIYFRPSVVVSCRSILPLTQNICRKVCLFGILCLSLLHKIPLGWKIPRPARPSKGGLIHKKSIWGWMWRIYRHTMLKCQNQDVLT